VDDGIWGAGIIGSLVVGEAVMGRQGIENLTGVCEVCFEGEDTSGRVREVCQVDVEDLVALLLEVWDAVSSSFS
jgi:hypothetical protein